MSEIESFEATGSPSPDQERIIIAGLEKMLRDEKRTDSRWKMTARAQALGLGAGDLRSRVKSWASSQVMTWQGTGPQDLRGRGDAK